MQAYINLVHWKGLDLLSTEKRCKASVERFECSPTVWAEWTELKENLAKFQAETGKQTSDDKESDDMISKAAKAERKRKSDASPVEFCHRSLARGSVWDSLGDLSQFMQLRGVGADDVQEVREIVQLLIKNIVKPARSKRYCLQAKTHVDHLLFQLVDDMHSIWPGCELLSGSSPRIGEEGNQ